MKRSDRPQLFQHISMRVFFLSQCGSFSVSDGEGRGRRAAFGEVYIFATLQYPRETEVKDFFVCSFRIVAHKKDAHCGRAVLKGLYLCKTSLLLQG